MIKNIYVAGPLFNTHERNYLEDIVFELEKNGYECFLPHRDQSGIDESELEGTDMTDITKKKIFNNDLDALKEADLVIALITGQDIDSGTSAEIGYTYANGKPISERRYRNLFVEGMIIKTVNDVDEIVPTIKKLTF